MVERMQLLVIGVGAVCALQACAIADPEEPARTRAEAMAFEDGVYKEVQLAVPPAVVVDRRGQRWLRQRAVVPVPDPVGHPTARASSRSPSKIASELVAMSDAELAEKIRPISLYQGHEYTLEQPPLEQARQFRAELERRARGLPDLQRSGKPSEATLGPLPEAMLPKANQPAPQIVIGTDSRAQRRDNTTYPWRSILWITSSSQSGGGTAQLIGASTAVSAAHVFHSGSGWYSTRRWAPGVDSQDANPYPYGRTDGCYWVTIPAAYDGDSYYDFAVIEFSNMFPTCNLYPGNTVGWMGWWSGYVPSGSEFGYVYGYPGDPCPGGSCHWPQIWGIGSTGMDEDGDNVDHYADTTGGESGSGLYIIDGGTRYVIGAHRAGFSNIFDDWNEARRLEGLFYSFMKDYTAL